jgi:hypothetical protein
MATEAQISANQANAQKSTGPTSETGKASSSQNNFRHGFTGQFRVLDWERQEDFTDLLARFCVEHQPANECEIVLVERIAQHFWLAGRALRLQEQCFRPDLAMKEADAKLALYLRYQTTHERAFRQHSDELRKLRNEKRKAAIGFESQQLKKDDLARKQQIENRKQELHQCELWLAEAKAEHQELLNYRLETPEMGLPNRVERILARQQAA